MASYNRFNKLPGGQSVTSLKLVSGIFHDGDIRVQLWMFAGRGFKKFGQKYLTGFPR
jgi:hypothetical protein